MFPTHSALSPGLMVMTCACPRKVVYGISLMTSGESPQMIFDVIMSRFPPDYSPNIIYDNACKRVRKNLSCASASLNGNVFANPESFCWLPRRGSSLFEIIWMISHRTYFPLFPSLFFVSSAKNILIQIIFPLPYPFFHPLLKRISSLSLSVFFSPPYLHIKYMFLLQLITSIFSFFIILLLSKQMNVWIKSRNCVCHFVFFMQYVVKCTMSWFTRSIRKVFV